MLKILHLEDLKSDSDLVDRELKKAGIRFTKTLVETRQDYIDALENFQPDLILSDHSLPAFNSGEALAILKNSTFNIPFILVTATVSEEYAVNIIKEGAADYILKDRLQRLPNAVLSAIERVQLERDRTLADKELRRSEKKYKLLFEANPLPMFIVQQPGGSIVDVNNAALQHYGYSRQELLNIPFSDLAADDNGNLQHAENQRYTVHRKKDNTRIYVDIIQHAIDFDEQPALMILVNDISEKIRAEKELQRHRSLQQKLLAKTSIQAQEKEREEIGKELHDNINQILAATKLYIETCLEEEDRPELTDMLNKSNSNLEKAIQEIRMLSHRLVAPSLRTISLSKAIQELIANLQRVTALRMDFQDSNLQEEDIDTEIKLMCYRIVQEQLNNILKHANARNSLIKLSNLGDHIRLVIQDDGKGFDMKKTSPGIGLRNIANRAELYNGNIALHSSPGKGCTLEVNIPVSTEPSA